MSIRTKLLLLSIAVLSIPYVGYQYLREMEQYLRDSLEASLQDTAIAVAGPLHNKPAYFPGSGDPAVNSIFVHRLAHPMQVDGYTDDWLSYIGWSDTYADDALDASSNTSFKFIISRHQQYYYVLLQVNDDQLVYRNPAAVGAMNNDHVSLVFTSLQGVLSHYYFSPADAGEFTPVEFVAREDEFGFRQSELVYRTNVSAVWRETETGYNLEMAIPVDLIGERLGIVVTDVDDLTSRSTAATIATAGSGTFTRPGRILQSSVEIENIINSYARVEGRRIWVLDKRGQVLASAGGLDKDLSGTAVNLLYSLILPAVHEAFRDDLSGASRLQGEEINEALTGVPGSRWRTSPDGRAIIVSAAAPVLVEGQIRGVVMVEETTTNIQIQQRQAMASLFNKSLLVFMSVTLLLLVFATRLSMRIRQLEKQADAAIDTHGRVVGEFQTSRSRDEIGDLSRNYAAMLGRLRNYNEYLENMAGRLSHELRTPIAVVQSSLDQFHEADSDSERLTYLERARDGISRLNTIVVRLSEATRLEHALQGAARTRTDIRSLLANCIEGYRIAWPEEEFRLISCDEELLEPVAADLIVQMLDKLVRNALDFRVSGTPVEIELELMPAGWQIVVRNSGPVLPDAMLHQLFNSMVSIRDSKVRGEPHLGLGLYIVRLIVEFHGGTVAATNMDNAEGVAFTASFPITDS